MFRPENCRLSVDPTQDGIVILPRMMHPHKEVSDLKQRSSLSRTIIPARSVSGSMVCYRVHLQEFGQRQDLMHRNFLEDEWASLNGN